MKIRGNRIEIVRGETFTLDKLVVNQDGSPFIVSDQLLNPRIVITVTDSKYNTGNRYIKNYLLPVDLAFNETVPVNLKSLLNEKDGEPRYDDFPDDLFLEHQPDDKGYAVFIFGYITERGRMTGFAPKDAVFYLEAADGTKTYKYWVKNQKDHKGKWYDYDFPITMLFPSFDTRNWLSRQYYWSAKIISDNMPDVVINLSQGEIIVNSDLKGV